MHSRLADVAAASRSLSSIFMASAVVLLGSMVLLSCGSSGAAKASTTPAMGGTSHSGGLGAGGTGGGQDAMSLGGQSGQDGGGLGGQANQDGGGAGGGGQSSSGLGGQGGGGRGGQSSSGLGGQGGGQGGGHGGQGASGLGGQDARPQDSGQSTDLGTVPPATCGDGHKDPNEDCDDGNTVTETCTYGQTSCTVCNSTCRQVPGATSYCGDHHCDSDHESATSCPADCSSTTPDANVAARLAAFNVPSFVPNISASYGTVSGSDVSAACTGAKSSGVAIICVLSGATAGGSGTLGQPFASVQAAVAAAKSGDVIKVAQGTYTGNILVSDKTLRIEGGYAPATFSSRVINADATHLVGAGGDSVLRLTGAGSSLVDNFTIRGGSGYSGAGAARGGGVYLSDSSATISNNIIRDNKLPSGTSRDQQGAGVYVGTGSLWLVGNQVIKNLGGFGAGIYLEATTQNYLENNTVADNIGGSDHAGGISISGSTILKGNNIYRNIVAGYNYGWGGGAIAIDSRARILSMQNRFAGNHSPSRGVAIDSDEGSWWLSYRDLIYRQDQNGCSDEGGNGAYASGPSSTLILIHDTIVYNRCGGTTGGNGVFTNGENNRILIVNSIFWENRPSSTAQPSDFYFGPTDVSEMYGSDSQEAFPQTGSGNISADPQFMDPANDDYRLMPTGPGINAAISLPTFSFDPNGTPKNIGYW